MSCFALAEECGLVFFELTAGLADSWHVVTALVLRVGVEPTTLRMGTVFFIAGIQRIMEAMAGLVSALVSVLSFALLPLSYRSWI